MRHAHRTALFHRNAKQARTPFGRRLGQAGLFAGVSLMALATLMQGSAPAWAQGEFAVDVTDPNVQVDLSVLNDGGIGPRMGAPVPAATSATAAPRTGQGGYRAPGPTPPVSTLYIQPSGDYALPPQTKPLIAEPQAEPAPTQDAQPTQTARAPEPVEEAAAPEPVEASAPEPVEASAPEPVDIPEPPQETLAAPEPVSTPAPVSEPAPQEPEVAQEAAQEVAKAAPTPPPAPEVAQEPAPEPAREPQPAPAAESAAAPDEDIPPPPPAVGDATPQPEAAPDAASAQKPADLTAPEKSVAQTAPKPESTQATAPANKVTLDLPPKLDTPSQPGVAALPPATDGIGEQDGVRIVFEADSSKLPTDAREALSVLAKRLEGDDTLRLQLLAYAGDADTSASAARRLSLSRALAVRSYLIENGVRSTRIDVRALGNKSTDDVTERVDVNVMER